MSRWSFSYTPKELQKCIYCQLTPLEKKLLETHLLQNHEEINNITLPHLTVCPKCWQARLVQKRHQNKELKNDIQSYAKVKSSDLKRATDEKMFWEYVKDHQLDQHIRKASHLFSLFQQRLQEVEKQLGIALEKRSRAKGGNRMVFDQWDAEVDQLRLQKKRDEDALKRITHIKRQWEAMCEKKLKGNNLCRRLGKQ
jgi:SMC interacting uncharacterized protein involved in chromosome segregation